MNKGAPPPIRPGTMYYEHPAVRKREAAHKYARAAQADVDLSAFVEAEYGDDNPFVATPTQAAAALEAELARDETPLLDVFSMVPMWRMGRPPVKGGPAHAKERREYYRGGAILWEQD